MFIAFLIAIFAIVLLIISASGVSWLETESEHKSLWDDCYIDYIDDCAAWQGAVRAFIILGLMCCIAGTVMIGLGWFLAKNVDDKWRWFLFAIIGLACSLIFCIIALIIFPTKGHLMVPTVTKNYVQQDTEVQVEWSISWGYGIGWGAVLMEIGLIILLVLPIEKETATKREKIYYVNHGHDHDSNA